MDPSVYRASHCNSLADIPASTPLFIEPATVIVWQPPVLRSSDGPDHSGLVSHMTDIPASTPLFIEPATVGV